MTPQWRRKAGDYVPLSANYYMDPAIREVGPSAELAFVRSLAVSKYVDRGGVLSYTQCADVKRGLRGWNRVVGALVEHNLWIPAPDASGFCIRSWSDYNPPREAREVIKAQASDRQKRHRDKQKESTEPDVSHVTSRPKRRGEERREELERSPSGSDRSSSPAAAPRGTGGAAHPPDLSGVRLALKAASAKYRSKATAPATVGNGKSEHVDFSASMAKLAEAAERLAPLYADDDGDAE